MLEQLRTNILIGDGAMGTLLYTHGIGTCFEELNISKPEHIVHVHEAYIDAGANVIQTNTYGANRIKLARYGLEQSVTLLNRTAVQLAKKAATNNAFVIGTMGGLRGISKHAIPIEEIEQTVCEQLFALLSENLDGLLLETYYDLEEIKAVLTIARRETSLPIIANVSLHEIAVLQDGTHIADAMSQLEDLGANIVGMNCRLGPHHMLRSLEEVPLTKSRLLSVYPNASLPDYNDGKLVYETNEFYFGETAKQFQQQGARLIGGCCGTTPAHIKAIASALHGATIVTEKQVKTKQITMTSAAPPTETPIQTIAKQRTSILVELDPPKKLGIKKFFEGAKALHAAGIDALTLADNSLATPRISNIAIGSMLKPLDIRSVIHITCRDRNLIGLQSHLMGLHTLGLHDILAVTGDPSKIGSFPGSTSVYDLASFDLISLIRQFNEGLSYSGESLGQKTNFSIAAAFNPNVKYLDKAVERLEKKINCGANYFISQPIFSEKQIEDIYKETKHLDVPIYIGIMPLTSSRNAEFLHHEVPGITLSDSILAKMSEVGTDTQRAEQEGIAIAKSLIDVAHEYFNGIYLVTPFLRYQMTVQLTNYIHIKTKERI